jgi:hypothetical protein
MQNPPWHTPDPARENRGRKVPMKINAAFRETPDLTASFAVKRSEMTHQSGGNDGGTRTVRKYP